MLVPGAAMSGLITSDWNVGPRELPLFMRLPNESLNTGPTSAPMDAVEPVLPVTQSRTARPSWLPSIAEGINVDSRPPMTMGSSPALWLKMPSAIGDRQMLAVQMKTTRVIIRSLDPSQSVGLTKFPQQAR